MVIILKKKIFQAVLLAFSISILLSAVSFDAEAATPAPPLSLNVGLDPSLPPFQFESNGEFKGLNIDILNSIASENNIEINYIPMNRDVGVDKLLKGEIDLILGIRYDAALAEKVDYTESLVQSVVCMLAKSELYKDIQANLNNSSYLASVENNSVELSFLRNIRRVNYNVAFNQEDAFELLLMGRADFLLGVKDTVEYLLDKHNLSNEYTIMDSYTTPVEYSIAVKPDNKKVANIINYGLSRLKLNGQYEKLYDKWLQYGQANAARRLKEFIRLSLIVAVVAGIFFLIGAIWNIKLKEQVKLKTKELSRINADLEAQIVETRNNIELKELICESSPRGIAIFDLEGAISKFNTSALKMAALSETPVGQSIYDIEPMNLMLRGTIDNVLINKISYTCDEFKYVKNGREFIYRYVMYPLNDYENKLRGVIITIEDITEEKNIKNQIIERDKNNALTQIVSGISHEIRNPLTTIKTFIELIPSKIGNKKFREEIAVVVPEEINRVDDLIESLIDYARPRSQNKTSCNLGEIVDSCVVLFKPVLEQNGIDINTNTGAELYVYCDKNQIKQAIINFLLNSIDAIIEKRQFMPHQDYKGKISIEGCIHEDEVVIEIQDNGIGMDEQELEKACGMFYTTKEKGTGLGIPLSMQMLNMNSCKVAIKSQKSEFTNIILRFSR